MSGEDGELTHRHASFFLRASRFSGLPLVEPVQRRAQVVDDEAGRRLGNGRRNRGAAALARRRRRCPSPRRTSIRETSPRRADVGGRCEELGRDLGQLLAALGRARTARARSPSRRGSRRPRSGTRGSAARRVTSFGSMADDASTSAGAGQATAAGRRSRAGRAGDAPPRRRAAHVGLDQLERGCRPVGVDLDEPAASLGGRRRREHGRHPEACAAARPRPASASGSSAARTKLPPAPRIAPSAGYSAVAYASAPGPAPFDHVRPARRFTVQNVLIRVPLPEGSNEIEARAASTAPQMWATTAWRRSERACDRELSVEVGERAQQESADLGRVVERGSGAGRDVPVGMTPSQTASWLASATQTRLRPVRLAT